MKKIFQVICADPPWGDFKDSLKMSNVKRGASSNYSTMTTFEIKQLSIKDIADPAGAILALWTPSCMLQEGLDTMKAWGFDLKQSWIWVKIKKDPFKKIKQIDWNKIDWNNFLSFGMGRLGRNVHEVVLIGTRGKIYNKLKNKSQRTVFFAPNERHSKKPEILQDKLDLMFPDKNINKLELFARRHRQNWICLGNEVCNGEDIRVSLSKL